MVATKLAELTAKGIEAVSSSSASTVSQSSSSKVGGNGNTAGDVHNNDETSKTVLSNSNALLSSVGSPSRRVRSQSIDASLDTKKDSAVTSKISSVPASPLRSAFEDTIASASSFASATLAATLSREDNKDIDDIDSISESMRSVISLTQKNSTITVNPPSFKDTTAFSSRVNDLPPRAPSPRRGLIRSNDAGAASNSASGEAETSVSTDSSLNKSSWWSGAEYAGSAMSSSSRYIADSLNDAVESAWSYIPSPSSFVDLSMPTLMGGSSTKQPGSENLSVRTSEETPQPNNNSSIPKQRSRRNVISHNLPSLFKNPYAIHTHEPSYQTDTLASVRNMLSYIPPDQSADEEKATHSILSPFLQHHHRRSVLSPLSSIDSDEERSTCSAHSSDKGSADRESNDIEEPRVDTGQDEKLNDLNNRFKRTTKAQQRRRRYLESGETPSINDASSWNNAQNGSHQRSEAAQTASRLAEGTVRALRDIALDEAVELNEALQFWTERWEHPALAWLEAGPTVWLSREGYRHQKVGQKVSQIQAVLARRCASIGELQQHLWRAGWQQGVAQWGVIGEGTGKWATVVGGDGALENEYPSITLNNSQNDRKHENFSSHAEGSAANESSKHLKADFTVSNDITSSDRSIPKEPVELLPHAPEVGFGSSTTNLAFLDDVPNAPADHPSSTKYTPRGKSSYYKVGNNFVTVERSRGGEIVSHDPAFVIWTVDALRMVRDQVYRASDGLHPLPYYENWPQERDHFGPSNSETNVTETDCGSRTMRPTAGTGAFDYLPLWATYDADDETFVDAREDEQDQIKNDGLSMREDMPNRAVSGHQGGSERPMLISNLPLMATEVSELLDAMELLMQQQRDRRGMSATLRPMSPLRRNWYVGTILVPAAAYTLYQSIKTAKGVELARRLWHNICEFYAEHVADPVAYVYQQLFESRPREDVADKAARKQAIASLKIMLKDWLKQRFPSMSPQDRERIVNNMDLTLLEKRKEESVKTALWEINDIVHMSLIEMQFIKKELFNAMVSMDELMQSNEFNFKLAAMTPAIVVFYGVNKMFRFLFYALLKLGKSREQIHEQLRLAVIDMERLLVMRDSPPSTAPPPLSWKSNSVLETGRYEPSAPVVLSSDDLGMLMLLIHECRFIMLNNRRRFSQQEFRSMAEDLAELSGERGPVSVKQQLLIISRMFRTYSFLKVVSSGVSINISRYMEQTDRPF